VYAVGHPGVPTEGRLAAALFYAGPGSALSHTTCLWWLDVWRAKIGEVHVSSPSRCSSVPGVVVRQRRRFDRTWHRRMPVTALPQALLDSATVLPIDDLSRCLAEADFRGLLDAPAVRAVTGRGRPGSSRLVAALAAYLPELAYARSELERAFLHLCQLFGMDLPEVNVWVEGFLVDAVWRDRRVIVELDGGSAHSSRARMERDRRRDLALRAAGYIVLRYTWQMITREPERVTADLNRALQVATR
jgi:uncharacterized protein DUF559